MCILSIGGIGASLNSFDDLERQYAKGNDMIGNSDYPIIKVLGVEEQSIEDEKLEKGEKFYLVEHEKGFVMLKATKEELSNVLGGRELISGKLTDLGRENIYFRAGEVLAVTRSKHRTHINIPEELQKKFADSATKSYLIKQRMTEVIKEVGYQASKDTYRKKMAERPFYTDMYVVKAGKSYYISTVVIAIIFILITITLIYSILKNVFKAKRNYESLFVEYPEVEYDLDILVREASFIDEQLKLLIYKDALIAYNKTFNFEILNNIETITFNREILPKSRDKNFSFDIVDKSGKKVNNISIGNHKENPERYVVKVGKLLEENYGITVIYNF
ncbi:hypothetical protein [Gemella cuniculi]